MTSEVAKKSKLPSKRSMGLLAIAVVLLAAVAGASFYYASNKQTGLSSKVCSQQQLKDAKNAIDANAKSDLDRVVKAMKQDTGYTHDPNCMFVVVKNDVVQGDISQANHDLVQLMSVYDSKKGLSSVLSKKSDTDIQALARKIRETNQKNDGVQSVTESQI